MLASVLLGLRLDVTQSAALLRQVVYSSVTLRNRDHI